MREIEPSTGHLPNCWHYGAVFWAYLHSGDEAGALAIQSEWRALQSQAAVVRLGRGGDYGGGAGCDGVGSERGDAGVGGTGLRPERGLRRDSVRTNPLGSLAAAGAVSGTKQGKSWGKI